MSALDERWSSRKWETGLQVPCWHHSFPYHLAGEMMPCAAWGCNLFPRRQGRCSPRCPPGKKMIWKAVGLKGPGQSPAHAAIPVAHRGQQPLHAVIFFMAGLIPKLLHPHPFNGVVSLCWHGCVVLSRQSPAPGTTKLSLCRLRVCCTNQNKNISETGGAIYWESRFLQTKPRTDIMPSVRLSPGLIWHFCSRMFMESPLAPLKLRI